MRLFGKGLAAFICALSLLIIAPLTEATSLEKLTWLPLLTVNIKKLQPDKNCPQNQINDLKVDKSDGQINSDIGLLNWDLDCGQSDAQNNRALSETQKNDLVKQLFTQIGQLPSFKLRFKTINLFSDLFKNTFSSSLFLTKTDSALFSTLINDLLKAKLTLDLTTKKLTIEVVVKLQKLSRYIDLTEPQQRYLNNNLTVHYQSDLNRWFQGKFNIEWHGEVAEFAQRLSLSASGHVDLLKQNITLSALLVNAKKVTISLSEKQSWKTSYIKLKLSAPAFFNYEQLKIEKLPLHLRIGSSTLLTKVPRGKSRRIRIDKQKLPPLFMQLITRGKENSLLVDWTVALLNQKLTGKLFIDSEKVQLQLLENHIILHTLVKASARYVDGLDLFEIEKGMIKLNLLVKYQRKQKTVTFVSSLSADDVAGKHDDILFDGLSFSSDLDYFIDKKIMIQKDKQQLKIENLFVGVPIQALQIDAQINAGEPIVQHFKARLLGGRLDFDDFKLTPPSQTILNIAGVSLSEIIKFSAYPEIQSKAIIDGMLPLSLTINGPEITEGMIFARPPGGYIKVPESTVIKAMGNGNADVSFVMQLLSNFQFDTMQGRIEYTSDGESDLKIEIKGISPNISGAQPIHFNYSHQENILKLLKSLRFNDQLTRNIKERY
ncbi:YdbH domain-containing protein [Psychromonas hadalis]|uniref:YdbH domain-containing protein n=1 Tax=Psychromonas hadalis TaxID=211669 RepID=UPI0003B540BB|nr:YdbH domain-containing protein [Psychromonas hadalis]